MPAHTPRSCTNPACLRRRGWRFCSTHSLDHYDYAIVGGEGRRVLFRDRQTGAHGEVILAAPESGAFSESGVCMFLDVLRAGQAVHDTAQSRAFAALWSPRPSPALAPLERTRNRPVPVDPKRGAVH
jgi:hypothetical protein